MCVCVSESVCEREAERVVLVCERETHTPGGRERGGPGHPGRAAARVRGPVAALGPLSSPETSAHGCVSPTLSLSHTHTHTRTHIRIYTHTHKHTYGCPCERSGGGAGTSLRVGDICSRVCVIHPPTQTHTPIHTHIQTYTHTHLLVRDVCSRVRVSLSRHTPTHTHTHAHKHTYGCPCERSGGGAGTSFLTGDVCARVSVSARRCVPRSYTHTQAHLRLAMREVWWRRGDLFARRRHLLTGVCHPPTHTHTYTHLHTTTHTHTHKHTHIRVYIHTQAHLRLPVREVWCGGVCVSE